MEDSILGRLSGEIWNSIYERVLHESSTIRFCIQQQNQQLAVIRSESSCQGGSSPSMEDCRPPLALNLFAVSREMRRETLELYFKINCITIYAAPGFVKFVDIFWQWLLSLKIHERKLVRCPRSVTIWLGGFNTFCFPHWTHIRTAIGTFHSDIPVRLVVGLTPPSGRRSYYPESYEKFGLAEYTMFYSHLRDADRKLNQLRGQDREETSESSCTVHAKLALGNFVGRMPTLRRRGDISKPFEVGLPSDLDAVYDPELQKKYRGEEGLQMCDFMPERFSPHDAFLLRSCAELRDRAAEGLAYEGEVKQSMDQFIKQVAEQEMEQAVEQALRQTVKQAWQRAEGRSGEDITKRAMRRAIQEGAEKAIDRAMRRITLTAQPWLPAVGLSTVGKRA